MRDKKGRYIKGHAPTRKTTIISKVCPFCKTKFQVIKKKYKQKFCSHKCAAQSYKHQIKRVCKICNNIFYTNPHKVKTGQAKFCCRACYDISQKGKQAHNKGKKMPKLWGAHNSMWKNGFIHKASGYHISHFQGTRIRTNRLIMEQHIGRKLKKTEVVHHIDRNRSNNSIKNLMLMSVSDHCRLHLKDNLLKTR